jgi:AcrR family transcriptional regulator
MPRVVDVEERRALMTDAAARLIAMVGIEGATMREVAAEAGLTTGAVTHYFADKRALLLATFEASLAQRHANRVERTQAGGSPSRPLDQLGLTLEGALPIDDDRRRHWMVTLAFCVQANGDPELAATQTAAYRAFRSRVAHIVELADLARGDDAAALAGRLIAAANGIAIQACFDPEGWPPSAQQAALAESLRNLLGS